MPSHLFPIDVYNLEFPSYVNQLRIGDYIFERVPNYSDALLNLQFMIHQIGGEISRHPTHGINQITATVRYVADGTEKIGSLPWAPGNTQLEDILLLLDIFTGRDVFAKNLREGDVILRDPRWSHYGGCLHCAIEYETVVVNDDEGMVQYTYDIGFEKTINKVLQLISMQEWHNEFGDGHFLFMYRAAMRRQILEASFMLCWTIWNQIYSIQNSQLGDEEIRRVSEKQKLIYLFEKYFFSTSLPVSAKEEVERLCRCRHRIVHIGKKATNVDNEEMDLFIRATEFLVAKSFRLRPSNIFNTSEKLASFLGIR